MSIDKVFLNDTRPQLDDNQRNVSSHTELMFRHKLVTHKSQCYER